MSNRLNPRTDPRQPTVYEIRIKGHLDSQWTDWFEGLTITLGDIVKCCGSAFMACVPGAHTLSELTMLPSRRAALRWES